MKAAGKVTLGLQALTCSLSSGLRQIVELGLLVWGAGWDGQGFDVLAAQFIAPLTPAQWRAHTLNEKPNRF